MAFLNVKSTIMIVTVLSWFPVFLGSGLMLWAVLGIGIALLMNDTEVVWRSSVILLAGILLRRVYIQGEQVFTC